MQGSSIDRKNNPLATGVLDYFPDALAAVARLSKVGNEKHNPGQRLHHARGKSTDHADCILRHLVDRGKIDPEDGQLHSAKVAWRALANLQEELERDHNAELPRGASTLELPTLDDFHGVDRTHDPVHNRWGINPISFDEDSRMVPTITGIEDDQECENNIDQRVAGDTPLAKKLKNEYYRDLYIGERYDITEGAYTGFVCCLLLGFEPGGDAVFRPWGLSENHTAKAYTLVPVTGEDHWDLTEERHALLKKYSDYVEPIEDSVSAHIAMGTD